MIKFKYKSQKLRLIFLFLFIGIFLGREIFFSSYILFLSLLFGFITIYFRQYLLLLCSIFLLGNFYGQYRTVFDLKSDILPNFYNQKVELNAWITNFPDIRQKNNRVFIQITKLKKKTGNNLGKALLIYPSNLNLDYGDNLKIIGKIQKPRNFDGFNYQKFLKRFEIQSIIKNPEKIEILEFKKSGNFLILQAKKIRNFLANNLEKSLPTPHNQIAMGILLGVKKELPKETSQNFKNSGLQHILVVSGFNVTVLLLFIAIILKQLGQRIIFFFSITALLFFVLMVGADPPVIRAAIFGSIVSWSVFSGKFSDSRNLLFFTAVILAIVSPQMIQGDIGFFLSFFATFGIILGVPICQKYLQFVPNKFELRTIISVIISAQLSVFPILSLYFGSFPFIGFFSNIFVEPFIPIGMFFSFISSVFSSFLNESLSYILVYPAKIILSIILFFADFFGSFNPFPIPKIISQISLIIVISFFLWGSFSLKYQETFLEK